MTPLYQHLHTRDHSPVTLKSVFISEYIFQMRHYIAPSIHGPVTILHIADGPVRHHKFLSSVGGPLIAQCFQGQRHTHHLPQRNMEERVYGVLRGKMGKIKRSNVDPAWLAGELLAADIIGNTDFQRASNSQVVADERRAELVLKVMGNGAPDVFQTLVSILLKENPVKWLGEELKGMTHDSYH